MDSERNNNKCLTVVGNMDFNMCMFTVVQNISNALYYCSYRLKKYITVNVTVIYLDFYNPQTWPSLRTGDAGCSAVVGCAVTSS